MGIKLRSVVLLLLLLLHLTISQKAFIMTTSVGYYNYRQQANTMEIYHLLKQFGFEDHNLLLLFPENIGCCQKNALQGSLSFRDNDYTNLNRHLEVDYKYYSMSSQSIADTLMFKYPPERLNFKKLPLNN